MRAEQLQSLTKRDPLAFGVAYVDLLEDRHWEVSTRAWATEIYQAVNPWYIERDPIGRARRLVVTKSTQAGISTMALTKMLHFATNWPVRIFYTLPRQQDVLDMVTTRMDPMIAASPYLRSKLGQPDSAHAKRIGDSYVFFMELSVEPRMMPADSLFVDEVDLSNPDFMSTALNRLDASRWKLSTYLSTPTVPNYGIHGLYNASDMRQWFVKCPACNHEQTLDWEQNLRVVGAQNNPTRVYYACTQCGEELTVPHIQTGRWVAEHPERSDDVVGYHVHQMLTTPAWDMYKIYRDPQTKLVEFYRKRLGKPYEIGGGSLERDDILATCFDAPYDPEPGWDGKSTYYLGADQGNELQVLVSKVDKNSRRPKIVHIELIPMNKGFDRLAQLIDLYHVRKAVVDGSPNRHESIRLVKRFPGRVLIADYIEQKEPYIAKRGMKEFPDVLTNVTINRTTGFDGLMASIKDGQWQLPGTPPNLSPDVELVIDHLTALKRDIETRRTQSGETQVAVWRKLRAEHLAHAWLYMKTAMEVEKGRTMRVAVIGSHTASEPTPDTGDVYRPKDETIVGITEFLAEVPKEQLSEFLGHYAAGEQYDLPFPLSYKLKRVLDQGYEDQDIAWVMELLINQKKSAPKVLTVDRNDAIII